MKQKLLFQVITLLVCIIALPLSSRADSIDELEATLRDKPQNQEKVYVQTDNSTYFLGDTLWYKAFVVTARDNKPTALSRLLYVELLNAEGYLIERQHIIINKEGSAQGQFFLPDSLYSGYYEIRAYTRWQLNFNVEQKDYSKVDREKFFNEEACRDFFRSWEGLYSRVVPVYQKPRNAGEYDERYILSRPKQSLEKEKIELKATFFPEGGRLVKGVSNNVAFEVTDQNGQGLNLEGALSNGNKITAVRQGRGAFTLTPDEDLKATFQWEGKDYKFSLPDVDDAGVVIRYTPNDRKVAIESVGVQAAACAVLCRGSLVKFQRLSSATTTIDLSSVKLPTGVNEIVVYGADAQPIASRMIFANNHDMGKATDVVLTQSDGSVIDNKTKLPAYSKVTLTVPAAVSGMAVAIRDKKTDDRGYDNGNIMTDMLLCSDLKGFVANPSYYFESDDAEHVQALDLLMQIQGWRKYKRVENARYLPETNLTFQGTLYKFPSAVRGLMVDDITGLEVVASDSGESELRATLASFRPIQVVHNNNFVGTPSPFMEKYVGDSLVYAEDGTILARPVGAGHIIEPLPFDNDNYIWNMKPQIANPEKGMLEAEIVKGKDVAGASAKVDEYGHFRFNIPPYYDEAFFFVKSYNQKDSVKLNMLTGRDGKRLNEEEYPSYYVKRDLFFPVFTKPYSWYQTNSPDTEYFDEEQEDDELIPQNSRLAGDHRLQNVVVRAKRRGRRGINYSKPAFVIDAYEAYNMVTDYGLSFGVFDMKRFPGYLSECLFANMGQASNVNVMAKVNNLPFWFNYILSNEVYFPHVSVQEVYNNLHLKRLDKIKVYTDYDPRNNTGFSARGGEANVTFVFETLPEGAVRPSYRDRYYLLPGISYAESFYSPDYSKAVPSAPTDYRRTLYWNPNVTPSDDGTFSATFYNNSRETSVTISASAIDANGQMYYAK